MLTMNRNKGGCKGERAPPRYYPPRPLPRIIPHIMNRASSASSSRLRNISLTIYYIVLNTLRSSFSIREYILFSRLAWRHVSFVVVLGMGLYTCIFEWLMVVAFVSATAILSCERQPHCRIRAKHRSYCVQEMMPWSG